MLDSWLHAATALLAGADAGGSSIAAPHSEHLDAAPASPEHAHLSRFVMWLANAGPLADERGPGTTPDLSLRWSEGQLRLRGPTGAPSADGVGRVEVYQHGVWGPVCADHWTRGSEAVACRSRALLPFLRDASDGLRWLRDGNHTRYLVTTLPAQEQRLRERMVAPSRSA